MLRKLWASKRLTRLNTSGRRVVQEESGTFNFTGMRLFSQEKLKGKSDIAPLFSEGCASLNEIVRREIGPANKLQNRTVSGTSSNRELTLQALSIS